MVRLFSIFIFVSFCSLSSARANERWFQIEVITFVNPKTANDVEEKWPLNKISERPFEVELVDNAENHIEVTNIGLTIPFIQFVQRSKEISVPDANSDNSGISFSIQDKLNQASLGKTAHTKENLDEVIEQPFVQLDQEQLLFSDKFKALDRNSQYQILSYQSWRQHVGSKEEAIKVRIKGGFNYSQYFTKDGLPKSESVKDMFNLNQQPILDTKEPSFDNVQVFGLTSETTTQPNRGIQERSATTQNEASTDEMAPFSEQFGEVVDFKTPMELFIESERNNSDTIKPYHIWELDGSVEVYILKRYLHLQTNLAYRKPANYADFDYQAKQRAQLGIELEQPEQVETLRQQFDQLDQIQAREQQPFSILAQSNVVDQNKPSNAHFGTQNHSTQTMEAGENTTASFGESEVLKESPTSGIVEYYLNTTRRLRSTEFHYIDHPKIGIAFLITPYTPKHLEEQE